jgi:hypothetical protein
MLREVKNLLERNSFTGYRAFVFLLYKQIAMRCIDRQLEILHLPEWKPPRGNVIFMAVGIQGGLTNEG